MKEAATALLLMSTVLDATPPPPIRGDATQADVVWVHGAIHYQGQPFSGVLVTGGRSIQYQNGLRHGEDITYSDSGVLLQRRQWVQGKRHGGQWTWYESGHPWYHRTYREGQLEGTAFEWYDMAGSPLCRLANYVAGREVGRQRHWRPDGTRPVDYLAVAGRLTEARCPPGAGFR